MFKKYQHIERFGNDEVEGIEFGQCFIFPKIDGTNGSVWIEDGEIKAASRRRELSLESDNQGFYKAVLEDTRIKGYLTTYPDRRLFGEWLVPHSLKTYRDDAWRRFYIFDVSIDIEPEHEGAPSVLYLPFDTYSPGLEVLELDFIDPLVIINNPNYEKLVSWLDRNQYLIQDGTGAGEGIVIKNYDFRNKYGRQTWAKIVTSEFKEKHRRERGSPDQDGEKMIEESLTEEYCTSALVEKTYEKIKNELGWNSKQIPRLLSTVFHDMIIEEMWSMVKKNKMPTINFKTLNHFVVNKIKTVKPELF